MAAAVKGQVTYRLRIAVTLPSRRVAVRVTVAGPAPAHGPSGAVPLFPVDAAGPKERHILPVPLRPDKDVAETRQEAITAARAPSYPQIATGL